MDEKQPAGWYHLGNINGQDINYTLPVKPNWFKRAVVRYFLDLVWQDNPAV